MSILPFRSRKPCIWVMADRPVSLGVVNPGSMGVARSGMVAIAPGRWPAKTGKRRSPVPIATEWMFHRPKERPAPLGRRSPRAPAAPRAHPERSWPVAEVYGRHRDRSASPCRSKGCARLLAGTGIGRRLSKIGLQDVIQLAAPSIQTHDLHEDVASLGTPWFWKERSRRFRHARRQRPRRARRHSPA